MAFCHRKICFAEPLHECFFCNYEFCGEDLSRCSGCGQMFCASHLNAHRCSQILVQRSFIDELLETIK